MKHSTKTLLSRLFAYASLIIVMLINPFGILNLSITKNIFLSWWILLAISLAIAYGIYRFDTSDTVWAIGKTEILNTMTGAVTYVCLHYLFSGNFFSLPTIGQMPLNPSIIVPLFIGYAFGPVVGLFTGLFGNLFFCYSPVWCISNGLVGFIVGMHKLVKDDKKTLNIIVIISSILSSSATLLFFFNRNEANLMFVDPSKDIWGNQQISIFAGLSTIIGVAIIALVQLFVKNKNTITAIIWAMLANIIGIGFAALLDIFIEDYTFATAIVGEFLPAAGTNMIFIAILFTPIMLLIEQKQKEIPRTVH